MSDTDTCGPGPDKEAVVCDEGEYCGKHWAEELAEHAWMGPAAREQADLQRIVGDYDDQLRDAGRGHLVRPW